MTKALIASHLTPNTFSILRMLNTLADRLLLAYTRENSRRTNTGEPRLTKTDLWKAAGASSAAATHWFNGSNGMDLDTCFKVSPLLRVNPLWLFDGSREIDEPLSRLSAALIEHSSTEPIPSEDEFALVQQLDLAASCGGGRFADHVVVKGGLAFKKSSLRDFGVAEEHARIIYASGQSMEPTIGHGRVVLINTAERTPIDGKVFLICDPDGAMYLKRLVRDYRPDAGGMAWIMRSDNPNKQEYPDKLLPQDDRTVIVGRAVWNDNTL